MVQAGGSGQEEMAAWVWNHLESMRNRGEPLTHTGVNGRTTTRFYISKSQVRRLAIVRPIPGIREEATYDAVLS